MNATIPSIDTQKRDGHSLEELTSKGTGSGLEAEVIDESDITTPFDPKLIDVVTQQRTVDLLMSRLHHLELDLSPDFQRRANLWTDARKSSLIESMLLRIPIPSLYVAEDSEGNYQIVDGLQRMCAIAHFVKVSDLNAALGTTLNPLRLQRMQSLRELENKGFDDLSRQLKRRITETELTLHVIRAGTTPAVKFNIFSRINQGGLPLNAQEIRNAIYPGPWRTYVRTMSSSPSFRIATESKIKGERLEDHELILRFIALATLPRDHKRKAEENLDDFLNDFVLKRSQSLDESDWKRLEDDFQRAMEFAPRVFGRLAFRKHSRPHEARRPINRGLFETQAVLLARFNQVELMKLEEKSSQIIDAFGKAFAEDREFESSLLYATGRGSASNKRLDAFERIFQEALNA